MNVSDSRPTVLVYRKRLLSWSETFIGAQAAALERYRPVFAGMRHKEEGRGYMSDSPSVALEDHTLSYRAAKTMLVGLNIVPGRWRRALAAYDPTIVHGHFGWEAIQTAALARALSIPFVVTFHGMDIAVQRDTRAERRQRATAFNEAGRIIAVSRFIADKLIAAGAPAERIVVHRIGVDTERFAPGTAPRSPHEILFVGRLVEKKGLIHLIRAMPRVLATVADATVTVAGDGALRSELELEASRLGINVRWLGVQKPDQVRELMRRAAILCAPSIVGSDGNAEGLPMSIVEGQASGLPVIAFPSGGTAEGVLDGETGFVLPPGDEAGLADRIVALLTDPERRARFSDAARAWAVREFDLRTQTRRLEAIYDAVRAEARARDSGR